MIVDTRLQRRLIVRVVAYWFCSLVSVGVILVTWDIAQGPLGPYFNNTRYNPLWSTYAATAMASVLFLPVLLADTVLLSNRFAGPLYRVRQQMRALAEGRPVERISFRKQDDWSGLADDFNAVVDAFDRLKQEHAADAARPAGDCEIAREPNPAAACQITGKGLAPIDTAQGHAYADLLQNVT